jgi:hypothetical protein
MTGRILSSSRHHTPYCIFPLSITTIGEYDNEQLICCGLMIMLLFARCARILIGNFCFICDAFELFKEAERLLHVLSLEELLHTLDFLGGVGERRAQTEIS